MANNMMNLILGLKEGIYTSCVFGYHGYHDVLLIVLDLNM